MIDTPKFFDTIPMQIKTPCPSSRYGRGPAARTLYVTSGGGGATSSASTTRPPDLQDEGGGEEAEGDLNSEACMEMLQEALEEAAGAPVPYKYTPEPGGSQVSRRRPNPSPGAHRRRPGGRHLCRRPRHLPRRPQAGHVRRHRRRHHGLRHRQDVCGARVSRINWS